MLFTWLKQGLPRTVSERMGVRTGQCQTTAAEAWGHCTRSLLEMTPSFLLLSGFQIFLGKGEGAAWIQELCSWIRMIRGKGLRMMAQPEALMESMWVGHTPQLETIVSFTPATLLGVYYKEIIRCNRCTDKAVCYSEEMEAIWMSNNREKIKITM